MTHPLAPLTPGEITAARAVLDAAGVLGPSVRFAYVGVVEPGRAAITRFEQAGEPVPRLVRALLLDVMTGRSEDVRVSLTDAAVVARIPLDPAHDGHVPLLAEEHERVREIMAADEKWCAALQRRGIADPKQVFVAALSAGHFADDPPGHAGRRLVRVLAHWRPAEETMIWAHPVDGLVATVDLIERAVVEIVDTGALPIPQESGDYDDPQVSGPVRTTLKPLRITQPEGPGFTVDDHVLEWEGWRLRLDYDMREGLILRSVAIRDGERMRPVLHRASVAEMVVPYADPGPVRFWQNYFDTGEYQLGSLANTLELGCDCLGEITYLDAVIADGAGEPMTLRNAICIHEEDVGVLWKHTDPANKSRQTRRQRRLVISFFVTVGNYDYGFYWHLYLDGTIELEAKATGVVFTAHYDERIAPYASQVAPGLAAPYHQHLFNVRLDMAVDGSTNAVDEVEVERVPFGPDNPHGNAFRRRSTRLRTELAARRDADPAAGRAWHVVNPERRNRLGEHPAYALVPQAQPTLLAAEGSAIHGRATFATKHLWVTRYDEAERHPAGDLVNQGAPGRGLPAFAAADRDVDGTEIVVWHSFGMTHFPRPEDWPVMPVDRCGFALRPVGFFDRNPTLDVPPSAR
ncbi:primary-amine oxidase [Pseudonocardia sp. TRM90224]|uniref:primary-amine oxidase n=1 Tax=Pseudonocardia sp. TRM90224 TaxID=2812678 RepID=UPI001E59D780|nr:primary-amine oxidase [Pseudonocardia sp. TRM90224]